MSTRPSSFDLAGRRRVFRSAVRLGWGVADQGISSLSNLALGLFAARTLTASQFGAFSLAFISYTVVINAARGLATDPLLVRFSGAGDERWRRAASSATGTSLTVGLLASAISVVVGLVLPNPVGTVYVALGVGLAGLVVQDSWRFAFFAAGRGVAAFANDLFFGMIVVLVLVVFYFTQEASAANCLLAFGAAATLAAVLGAFQARTVPRPRAGVTWLKNQRDLSVRYCIENISFSGAGQIRLFVLSGVAGLAAVGFVRASEILMGPILVLLSGLSQVAVPEATRVFNRDPRQLRRFCLLFGGGQAATALGWGLVLYLIFPLGPGPALIKDLWGPTQPLLPAITFTVVGIAFVNAATAGLRAMGVARRSLRAQLIGASAYVIGATIGAIFDGALGASWGVAAAQFVAVLVWWHQLNGALSDHRAGDPEAPAVPAAVSVEATADQTALRGSGHQTTHPAIYEKEDDVGDEQRS